MTRKRRAPQLICDDLPIFTGTPIMVPDPTKPKAEEPKPPTPPVDEWGWCGNLLDASFDFVAE
jgi:hypothetical protein